MYLTALLIGLMGSVHCVAMCSPITLLIGGNKTTMSFIAQRLQYNIGRLIGYAVLGVMAGFFGQLFSLFGWQRWITVIFGIALLLSLLIFGTKAIHYPSFRFLKNIAIWLKKRFGFIYKRDTPFKGFIIGVLNGFLPCGLVYMALLGATTTSTFTESIFYMLMFGLGTWPMMLIVSFSGGWLNRKLRITRLKLLPYLIAILFIVRGLGLGIPYLSPAVEQRNVNEGIPVCVIQCPSDAASVVSHIL